MQIDHDPNEPSRRALKIIGLLTAVIVLAASIPVVFGMKWIVGLMSETALNVLFGIIFGGCVGFFLGRRDAVRQFRTPGKAE